MDHNSKQILPGFQFPSAFAGLQNAGTSSLMSTLGLAPLSGLPTPILNAGLSSVSNELAQWAANQQTTAPWLDAKMAAMLPIQSLYFTAGVKGLDLAQQNLSANIANGTSSSSLFQSLVNQLPQPQPSPKTIEQKLDSPAGGPLSNAPSSHPSTSTPHEIDVGSTSQPGSHDMQPTEAYDLSLKGSPRISTDLNFALSCKPSTSTSSPSVSFPPIELSALPTTISSAQKLPWSDHENDLMKGLFDREKAGTTQQSDASSATKSGPSQPGASGTMEEHDAGFDIFNLHTEKEQPNFLFGGGGGDGGLSPVQFTPPDSPTGRAHEEAVFEAASNQPSPIATPFPLMNPAAAPPSAPPTPAPPPAPAPTPAPTTVEPPKTSPAEVFKQPPAPSPKKESIFRRPATRYNRIPVYKQKHLSTIVMEEHIDVKGDGGDAYSFEDDEDQCLTTKTESKERFDADVREKLTKIATSTCEGKAGKNIYVPGVGFAVPQEPPQDLWRHVPPKKRPIENRSISSSYLMPSSARTQAEISEAAARFAEPEIVTLAESVRRRKRDRFVNSFLRIEPTYTNDCAKEEGAPPPIAQPSTETAQPPLPKIVLKLARKSVDEPSERKHRKKKRKKYDEDDEDSDWEESDKRSRRVRKLSERRDSTESSYELRFVEPEPQERPATMFKKTLRMIWQEGQEGGSSAKNTRSHYEFNTEENNKRLNTFGAADGHLVKGTFVVCKADLFRDDCPLWKVDNQNMLQKYPPRTDPSTKHTTYKNSSTYSGWCDQIASGYYRVDIRHLKQTRTESVVEPEIPLSDLFPAMTSELTDTNGFVQAEEEVPIDPNDHIVMLRDPLRMALYKLTQFIVDHALTLEHLQLLKAKNDWSYLQALTEIDRMNTESINKLRQQSKLREDIEQNLQNYTKLIIADVSLSETSCQACVMERKNAEKALQLLCRDNYDAETLLTEPVPEPEDPEEFLPSMEYFVCTQCANVLQSYHRCYHMKYHLLGRCEDKLEALGTQFPEYSPERLVEMAKKARGWQNKFFTETIDLWKKIQSSFSSTQSVISDVIPP